MYLSSSGTPQTPWQSNIDGAAYQVYNMTIGDVSNMLSVDPANRQLRNSSNVLVVDWVYNIAYDAGSVSSIDWGSRQLKSSFGVTLYDWQNGYVYDSAGNSVIIDLGSQQLYGSGGTSSVKLTDRQLCNASGGVMLEWGNSDFNIYDGSLLSGRLDARELVANDGTTVSLYWATQATTSITGASYSGGGGTGLTDTDTFDGYTVAQVVAALRQYKILA